MVSFCVLMIWNHLLTCDKNFQPEAYDMEAGLFSMYLFGLQTVETLGNLTDLQILINEELIKTFRLIKILRKMTCKDTLRGPGLLRFLN